MANFNKVILLGNLTRDIELRYTQGGTAIGKTAMAINRKFNAPNGESKESTCFVDMTAWGKTAEIMNQYLSKGSPLFVEGRLEYSTWEDKNGGGKRSKLEVVIENFQFVGAPQGAGGGGGGGGGGGSPRGQGGGRPAEMEAGAGEGPADYDGIPF